MSAYALLSVPGTPSKCKHCDGTDFEWATQNTINTPVVQGRLTTHNVTCMFVLGCVDCSETLLVVKADAIASLLNPNP